MCSDTIYSRNHARLVYIVQIQQRGRPLRDCPLHHSINDAPALLHMQHETLVRHPYQIPAGNECCGKSAPPGIRGLSAQHQTGPPLRGQWREKIEPLFPRYLFIRLNLGEDNIAPIRSTHGVTKLVSFSGQPATVPDPFIDALTQASDPDTGLLHPEKDLFEAGATVTIMDGPLHGLEAIFKVHDGEQRSIILLELLGKLQQSRSTGIISPASN